MNGSEMYNFARQSVPTEVEKILKKTKIKKEKVKFFIFHQASKLILETLQKSLGISKDKLFVNISEVGNTTSSSIPLAIQSLMNKKRIKKNDILLLSGFGVGYSWGTCLYKN
jgi:3-oxoacyl-[acyl-carrier-protein] synthase-3